MSIHKANHAAPADACQLNGVRVNSDVAYPNAVMSALMTHQRLIGGTFIQRGRVRFGCSRILVKPVTAVFANFCLILNKFSAVWATLGSDYLRFVQFSFCVGRNHQSKRDGYARQKKTNHHPPNTASPFAAGDCAAQNCVHNTYNKKNQIRPPLSNLGMWIMDERGGGSNATACKGASQEKERTAA